LEDLDTLGHRRFIGWEDKQYIHDRVYGMDKVKEEV